MGGDMFWEEWVNIVIGLDGKKKFGWFLEIVFLFVCVLKEYLEMVWLIMCGIEFIEFQGDSFWFCYLSYIKFYWFYLVLVFYNDMYFKDDLLLVNCCDGEFIYFLMKIWVEIWICKSFLCNNVRDVVVLVYMGLIKEFDDNMGCLFDYLEESGWMKDIMVVFCFDYGDNMGDYWFGEKDFFYDCLVCILLIVYDLWVEVDIMWGIVFD